MTKKMKVKVKKKMNIYDKRNAFGVQQKEAVLVAFRISKLRELKNLGPWKLMKNFLILTILHTCQLSWIIGESPGYDNSLPYGSQNLPNKIEL